MNAAMSGPWPAVPYDAWSDTRDTLHAHTQILGKLAVALAPPEPQLQHAALRLTARGWETSPLPAPDGSGALVVALDLHAHDAVVEHTDGRAQRVPLIPDRPVAEVTRDLLATVGNLVGAVQIDPRPQETPWTTPLDEDFDHARYDPARRSRPTSKLRRKPPWSSPRCAPRTAAVRHPSTRGGAPSTSPSASSPATSHPPSNDFIMRNSATAQQIEVGWWPGDHRYPHAAFFAFAFPAPEGFDQATLAPAAA